MAIKPTSAITLVHMFESMNVVSRYVISHLYSPEVVALCDQYFDDVIEWVGGMGDHLVDGEDDLNAVHAVGAVYILTLTRANEHGIPFPTGEVLEAMNRIDVVLKSISA